MRRAALAVLSGSLLVVGAPVAWLAVTDDDRQVREFGSVTAAAPPAAPTGPADAGPVGTRSARLADRPAPPVPALVRLAGQSAPVDPVGLDAQRLVVVPDDVRRVGWYAPGARPGDPTGSAVLVGHVDDADQGLGTFAVLADLQPGAEVVVQGADGRELVYDVAAREQFGKDEVPLDRLFAETGPHRLVLISCGGEFDRASGSYTDNVVVTAVPRAV